MKSWLYQFNATEPNRWHTVTLEDWSTHDDVAKLVAPNWTRNGSVVVNVARNAPGNRWPNGMPMINHAITCMVTDPEAGKVEAA